MVRHVRVQVRAHALVMWKRWHPVPVPWSVRNWPIIGTGIPYARWKYYQVEIVGEGWTQAERNPVDVEHMAADYMACKHNVPASDFEVEVIAWIRH